MKIKSFVQLSILFLFLLITMNKVSAQQITMYADASEMGYGFSYQATLNITKILYGNWQDKDYSKYEVKLVNLSVDPKGYLHRGKYYTTSQLGISCDPLKNMIPSIFYEYERNGTHLEAPFNLSDSRPTFTITLGKGESFKGLKNFRVSNQIISEDCRKKIDEINTPKTSTNQTTNSTSAPNKVVISPNHTQGNAQTGQSTLSSNELTKKNAQSNVVYQQIQAKEIASKEYLSSANEMMTNLGNLAGSIITSNARMKEENERKREERREKELIIATQNFNKGATLFNNNIENASQGNEMAIKFVDEAYKLMDKENERVKFLNNQYATYNSEVSRQSLIQHYSKVSQKIEYIEEQQKKSNWSRIIWGGILAGGGILGANQYIKSDTESEFLDAAVPIVGGVVIAGGAILAAYGGLSFINIDRAKDNKDYNKALDNLKRLKNNQSLTIQIYPFINRNAVLGKYFQGITITSIF